MASPKPAIYDPVMGTREGPPRTTLLLPGVGSLLGRCLLDSLQGRRQHITVVGGDADVSAPALDECDVSIALPPTDTPGFATAVDRACIKHGVDLVNPCRDPDNEILASARAVPESAIRLAGPTGDLVSMTRDKWRSYQWCSKRGIPFAPTVSTDSSAARAELNMLIAEWSFPLIAKPARGSGSLGVTVLIDDSHLRAVLATPGLVVQPFLSPPSPESLRMDVSRGVPLFWEVPCDNETGIMALIGPQGEIGPRLCFSAQHRMGRNESLWTVGDPELDEFADDVLPTLVAHGMRGPINLQVRRGRDGWRIIEINARFTGGTAARLLMGLDEVGWIMNSWIGGEVVPKFGRDAVPRVVRPFRELPVRGSTPRGGGADSRVACL